MIGRNKNNSNIILRGSVTGTIESVPEINSYLIILQLIS